MLLIFATQYDDVTEQTSAIARHLLLCAADSGIPAQPLFGELAVQDELLVALTRSPTVIAFYGHGDEQGRILTQDREPCWADDNIPTLRGVSVYAHACRALKWLSDQASQHQAHLLVGYYVDLKIPCDGSTRFWEVYREIHSFVPHHLAQNARNEEIRRDFYDLCTLYFHELNGPFAPLMEVIAVQESRDRLTFRCPGEPD